LVRSIRFEFSCQPNTHISRIQLLFQILGSINSRNRNQGVSVFSSNSEQVCWLNRKTRETNPELFPLKMYYYWLVRQHDRNGWYRLACLFIITSLYRPYLSSLTNLVGTAWTGTVQVFFLLLTFVAERNRMEKRSKHMSYGCVRNGCTHCSSPRGQNRPSRGRKARVPPFFSFNKVGLDPFHLCCRSMHLTTPVDRYIIRP
jgi:hypothetical protein